MTASKIRTIDPGARTVTPAAGGRIIVRDYGSVEVFRPSTGAVRLHVRGTSASLAFGGVSRPTLVIAGTTDELTHVFTVLTGITP